MGEPGDEQKIWTREEAKAFLEQEGCIFHEAGPHKIPTTDEAKLKIHFGDNVRPVQETLIPMITRFLEKPIIVDQFDDHEKRRAWRKTLPEPVQELYEQNKLKINVLAEAITSIGVMSFLTKDQSPAMAERLEKIEKAFLEKTKNSTKEAEYDKLELADKIQFVHKLEDAALEVLNLFAPDKPGTGS